MTKLGYASIYAIIATIMIFFMMYIGRDTDEKGRHVRRQLHLVFLVDVIYFISFFINDFVTLVWIHCLVNVFEIWILFMFLSFARRFAGVEANRIKVLERISSVVAVVDTGILLFNAATGRLFGFGQKLLGPNDMYIVPKLNGWYRFHIIACICIDFLLVFIMLYRSISVSYIYRTRYIILSITFFMGCVMCVILRMCFQYIQFPILLFITFAECIIFVVYYHMPKIRIHKMKNFVIKNVTLPIMMFDFDDELQVVNQPAMELMRVEKGLSLQDFIKGNNLQYILTQERRKAGKTKEFTLTIQVEEKTFLIHGQELWDKGKHFVGTLLVYNDISKQEKLKDEATFHATRDQLTGLLNREYFFETTAKTLRENPGLDFVIIVSDIYQFKMFNDILGKKSGDDLLLSISRGFDEHKLPNWVFSRMAGDRFALLMPAADYDEDRFERVCRSIIDKRDYALTVHFYLGVYHITDRSLSVADMCDRAYMALESIKGNLKKNVAYYDEEIRKRRLHDTLNAEELDRALREHQFIIYLQPQIDTVQNKIVGAEALVRWFNPNRGMIPPSEFITAFEENGMISQLDYYVWESACQQLQNWKNEGLTERSISVNISAKDFYLADVYDSLTGLVKKYEINPRNLKLEITETAFVLNVKEQMVLVKRLQDFGFIVEMDDFGSGYSSLNSLKDIILDVLKLDMKFFEKANDEGRAEKIIESSVQLAYNLNMAVIAEGVEDLEQVKMLQRIGCNIVQGYYYSKPMPVQEFEEFAKDYEFEDIHDIIEKIKSEK